MFGDSDNEDEGSGTLEFNELATFLSQAFIEIIRRKPILQFSNDKSASKVVGLYLCGNETDFSIVFNVLERFKAAKVDAAKIDSSVVLLHGSAQIDRINLYDIIVLVKSFGRDVTEADIQISQSLLVPGGAFLLSTDTLTNYSAYLESVGFSCNEDFQCYNSRDEKSVISAVTKVCIFVNHTATVYWNPVLGEERRLLKEITIPLSTIESRLGLFAETTLARAVFNMQTYGFTIFQGLFPSSAVRAWGDAAVSDMRQVLVELRRRGIDILATRAQGETNPSDIPAKHIENYHEMAMREARRCDLRNGKRMKEFANSCSDASLLCPASSSSKSSNCSGYNLRGHQGVLNVVTQVSNPNGGEIARGNWGRWNFEGPGPDAPPPPLTVGQVGAVMSLPGCTDQTIHADTSHLFSHTQLPGHYFNLFLPATDPKLDNEGLDVGQTAFVVGSHLLSVAYDVMVSPRGEEELNSRLVRPHLQAGDALLFDCRILHLGLANRHPSFLATLEASSTEPPNEHATDVTNVGWRPLLYINYHQSWFVDPKNWNDNESIFQQ